MTIRYYFCITLHSNATIVLSEILCIGDVASMVYKRDIHNKSRVALTLCAVYKKCQPTKFAARFSGAIHGDSRVCPVCPCDMFK